MVWTFLSLKGNDKRWDHNGLILCYNLLRMLMLWMCACPSWPSARYNWQGPSHELLNLSVDCGRNVQNTHSPEKCSTGGVQARNFLKNHCTTGRKLSQEITWKIKYSWDNNSPSSLQDTNKHGYFKLPIFVLGLYLTRFASFKVHNNPPLSGRPWFVKREVDLWNHVPVGL